MVTLFLTEPKPKQFVFLTQDSEIPSVGKPLKITRNGVVLNVRTGMTVVKALVDKGYAVNMDTFEQRGLRALPSYA